MIIEIGFFITALIETLVNLLFEDFLNENKAPLISFKNAYASDPISAFGGVIACNYRINRKIANEISKNFLEVILAKGFDKESLKILKRKK